MCGLYGVIPVRKEWHPQQRERAHRLVQALAVLSDIRGGDASGCALIGATGNIALFKDAVTSERLVYSDRWKLDEALRDEAQVAMIMGHTRFATCGPNTSRNAHPFIIWEGKYGSLVGSHNGGVWGHQELVPEGRPIHEVDSENLFEYLNTLPASGWVRALREVMGWFALAMYRNRRVYLIRDESTPLHVTYSHTLKSWVYASTNQILRSALVHSGLDLTAPFQPKPYTLIEIPQFSTEAYNNMTSFADSNSFSFERPRLAGGSND